MNACDIKLILAHPTFSPNGALVEAKSGHTVQQLLDTVATESTIFTTGDFQLASGETNLAVTDTLGSALFSAPVSCLFYPIVKIILVEAAQADEAAHT